MAFKSPPELAHAGVEVGAGKAALRWDKAVVAGFLAGAYIAFGGLLAISVSSGLDPETWGTLPTFFTGAVFSLGLILVVVAGSELLTGNMALVPMAAFSRRVSLRRLGENFGWVLIGNLLGSLFVAYFLADQTGVVSASPQLERLGDIATLKGVEETEWQIFLRALGCNWLVCLAVWMALAAEDVGGKVLAIFFPIMGFVAMGFDHLVANMFFLPAAIFAGVEGITWWDAVHNWAFAFLGNLVGAAAFVGAAYWYLYVRPEPGVPGAGGAPTAGDHTGTRPVAGDGPAADGDGHRAVGAARGASSAPVA